MVAHDDRSINRDYPLSNALNDMQDDAPRITASDGWSVVTTDGKLSAQFEHTVAVTKTGVEVLTLRRDERLAVGR